MSRNVLISEWTLTQFGQYFLVAIEPDGTAHTDGGHGDPAGVAKAKQLFESIDCIKPPSGTRYAMIRVEEVPDVRVHVNRAAITALNKASRTKKVLR